jgi:hypothetical protein
LALTISPFLGDSAEPGREAPRARVSLEWSRAAPDPCSQGTRTVEMMEVVALTPGQTITLEGDGGLRVELAVARP